MIPFLCWICLLLLVNCGQDAKSPAGPAQPEGPAADPTQIAVFADTSLEAAIREALKSPTGPLTQAELDSLTQLVARGRGIVDLRGIEHLDSLITLDLADNRITDLSPLADLARLTWLDLENNQVQDLSPLAGLAQLQTLILSFNAVRDLAPLADLPALAELEISGNPLDEVSLRRHLPALRARGVEVAFFVPQPEEVVEVSEPLPALAGRFAFSGEPGPDNWEDDSDIYAVSLTSTKMAQVTSNPEDEHEPAWSPDGRQIAFVRGPEYQLEQGDICVVRVDEDGGHDLVNLTNGSGDNRSPSWSPDGRRIAFARSTPTTLKQIYVMDADGQNLEQLTHLDGTCQYPCWSPDGQRIAFVAKPKGVTKRQLCLMDPDGSHLTQIYSETYILNPDWSPDGQRIAFDSYGTGGNTFRSIFSMAADGTAFTRHGEGWSPTWVDDTRLLYSLINFNGDWGLPDIYLLDLETQERVNLTDILRRHGGLNTLMNEEPSWTPTDW